MSLTTMQAVRQVLEQADGPLKAGEVADKVIPLVPTLKGKTPKATVAAKLYTAAKNPNDTGVAKVDGGFVIVKREGDAAAVATADDGPAVIPGTKVVRDGRKAKPDPKRKAKATA